MFKNYLKIAFRNLWKQRGYTFINLAGMAVGMACCFLLLIYVNFEKHYDEFHPNLERLYRVNYEASFSGDPLTMVRIPSPMAPAMQEEMPQFEAIARMYRRSITVREVGANQSFEIENAHFSDSTLQTVFGMDYLKGNGSTALHSPYSVVLTDRTAIQLFGKEDPMGKELLLANTGPFTVTGVVKDFPENAHIHFDMLVPYENMKDVEPPHMHPAMDYVMNNNWVASHSMTYGLLKEEASPGEVDEAFPAFMERHGHKELIENQKFFLFPVKDIHLRSTAEGELEASANLTYLRFFLTIGFLILLIACINFINLSTATYLTRMKEVGVRKVLGAGKSGLIGQFLGETLMLSFGAFLLAVVLVDLLLPSMGYLVGKELTFSFFENWPITLSCVGIFLLAGLLAGSYPAFFASRFRPAEIFQSQTGHTGGGGANLLRKALITVQFAVGILLISGTIIILSQLDSWKNQPLGFQRDNILLVGLQSQNMNSLFAPGDSTLRARMNSFEERVLQNPNVEAITLGSAMPGLGHVYHPVTTDEITLEDNVFLPANSVDYDYAETFGLKIVAGRDFDEEHGTDHLDAYVINESALEILRFGTAENAIGQKIQRAGKPGQVIGVVKDFNTAGLQNAIEPLVLDVSPGTFSTFGIRLNTSDVSGTLSSLENIWANFFPGKAFEYTFLDERLNESYTNEAQLALLGTTFAGIAIFLSCFGLFGLISLTVQQRAKEIGIRKVLGATVSSIVGLLSKDFLRLVAIAFLIATPIAYYFMEQWLVDFAYRIELEWWHFALAGAAALGIAFFTMSFQSIRAALMNPVKSLRSE